MYCNPVFLFSSLPQYLFRDVVDDRNYVTHSLKYYDKFDYQIFKNIIL